MADRENRTGIYEMPNEPKMADFFRIQLRDAALQLRSHSVARVLAYNPATQTASLSVDILQIIKDHFTPPTPAFPNPVKPQAPVLLQNIKVAWPRTGTGYITFPLLPNDTGELHVQDRSIDQWRLTGIPSDPKSAFIHMLGDSVFHPNLFPDTMPIAPPTSLFATVIEGPAINLGPAAVLGVARMTDPITLASMATLAAALLAWVPVPNDGGAALKVTLAAFLALPTPEMGTITGASIKVSSE